MAPRSRLLAPVALALALVALVAAGCGGGSESDAKALLRRAFGESIPSANVTLDISAQVDGVPQLSQPLRIKLGGPYKSNGRGTIPSINWDVSISGIGQTFTAGLISTGDQAFVNYQGTNYQVSAATMARLKQAAASRNTNGSGSLKSFGIDPLSWVTNASEQGDSDIAGVTTTHVSGNVDVGKLFADLNKIVARARGSIGAVRPAQLTPQQIDKIKQIVQSPHVDVYVGKKDGRIRRVALSLQFTVPAQDQAAARGIKGGNLSLSAEFAAVGQPQTIQAPANARPMSELTKQLGGLAGTLGQGIGGGTSSGGGVPGVPGGAPGSTGGNGNVPSQAQFQRYAQCLNKANPSDTAALARCNRFLRK